MKSIDKTIIDLLHQISKKEIILVFTKKDKIKNLELLKKHQLQIENIKKDLNKIIFNTSIKESNEIILLKKFLFNSVKD